MSRVTMAEHAGFCYGVKRAVEMAEQAARAGGMDFTIPFDRQGLADYLCVERSAMSAVLSRLREEGVLETHRNHFRLLRLPEEEV